MCRSLVWFVVGLVLGLLVSGPVARAADAVLMAGSYNGASKNIEATSTGAVKVQLN
jgi:hypothetical protein